MSTTTNHVQDHIDIIVKHEEEFLARRTAAERLGDRLGAFVGSLRFIAIHLAWFGIWILWNTVRFASLPHFDPPPYPMLDTVVALEAIFLVSFILMRQSRLSRRSDERDHLILQVLMLVEKEVTAVLKVDRQLAVKAGLAELGKDAELAQLSEKTSIDEVAQTIQNSITGDNNTKSQ